MLRKDYSPMYFLSSLGAGGLTVSFFMYLMFLVPHKGVAMATFDFVYPALLKGNWLSAVSVLALVFIIIFGVLHIKLLVWNIKQYKLFKQTDEYKTMTNGNSEVMLMILPLTFAMTINVFFVLGVVLIPGFWSIVEYLFPFALLGFTVVGYFAIKIFMRYFSRLLTKGDFDFTKNNNLSQMISIFAFVMIGVGFAAPGAMGHNIVVNGIGIFGAIFFSSIAILLLVIKLILGFTNMLEHGINNEASPSLWILIPILTLLGITLIRISFGLDHHFDQKLDKSSLFILTSVILSLQLIFGILGYKVMKKMKYFQEYILEDKKSTVSFSLICPGVAIMVFGMFFVNLGLTANGILDKYSISYFIAMLPFMYIQYKTVSLYFRLKKKFEL
jgi:hypothetical protein